MRAFIVSVLAIMAALLSACAPTSVTAQYDVWDGPIEKLSITVENTRRGLLEFVSDDELYPLAVSAVLNNSYATERFDLVDSRDVADCDYKIVIRFVNGTFSDVRPPSVGFGSAQINASGKMIAVDLTGRLVSCRTGRVLLSKSSHGTFFHLGDVGLGYQQIMSTPKAEQIMEGTITASKRALEDLIKSLMLELSRE